jgi:hypothetical protein
MVMPFLHTSRKRAPLLPETEEPMTTIDFITALFYEVDEQMRPIPKQTSSTQTLLVKSPLHRLGSALNRGLA